MNNVFITCKKYFYNSTTNEKRELLKTFISNLSLNKKEPPVEISLFQQGFAILERFRRLFAKNMPIFNVCTPTICSKK